MIKAKRLASAAFAIIMTSTILVADPVRAATSSELQRKQNQLQREKNSTQSNLNKANSEADRIADQQEKVSGQIDDTNGQLVDLLANVEMIEAEIADKENEIAVTQNQYENARAKEEKLYSEMCKRIKYLYEKGDSTYIEILQGASSFSDLTTKAGYASKLYEYDRKQMDQYVQVQKETAEQKAKLEDEKGELETTQDELKEEKGYLENMLASYKRKYADYDTKLANAKASASVYAKKLKEQTAAISSLDTEIARAKAQEEAARKAAEEARRKAAEEAAKKKKQKQKQESLQQTNQTSGESEAPKENPAPKPAKSAPPASGAATGSNIANYACQFVGNPYVFGGTSLTNGCDCSGFVYSVYGAYGIRVPRSSYALGSAGREVSYEDAQPGDVIVYPGHCAIYLGNGRIVHASSSKTGIKYGYALYRAVRSIRRFV